MELYPAIDLRGGRAVRLLRGDYDAETVYDDDPVARAVSFAEAGAAWVHVVDLDAARTGDPVNLPVIERICAAVPARVQVGGGVRSRPSAQRLWDAGVTRVVVGTAAVEDPALVDDLAGAGPVAVGLDARGGEVAVRGWTEGSGVPLLDLVRRFDGSGVDALVVTTIERDGTLEGPDVATLEAVLGAVTTTAVIASGGVGTLDDLDVLSRLGVSGVIVGKALYEGRFDVKEALAACSPSV